MVRSLLSFSSWWKLYASGPFSASPGIACAIPSQLASDARYTVPAPQPTISHSMMFSHYHRAKSNHKDHSLRKTTPGYIKLQVW